MGDRERDHGLLNYIVTTLEAMRDTLASRDDLQQVELRLSAKIEVEIASVRGDVEQVQLRLTSIEKALNTRLNQIETELSRLRSVVYLLVKDKPELLRLLGQDPSPS
jgi:hypothetical protein